MLGGVDPTSPVREFGSSSSSASASSLRRRKTPVSAPGFCRQQAEAGASAARSSQRPFGSAARAHRLGTNRFNGGLRGSRLAWTSGAGAANNSAGSGRRNGLGRRRLLAPGGVVSGGTSGRASSPEIRTTRRHLARGRLTAPAKLGFYQFHSRLPPLPVPPPAVIPHHRLCAASRPASSPLPGGASVRPPRPRPQTLFNWLGQDLCDSRPSTCTPGTGALSPMEALSRSTATAVAIDPRRRAGALARETARSFGVLPGSGRRRLARAWLANDRRRYDVIFLDPPFGGPVA